MQSWTKLAAPAVAVALTCAVSGCSAASKPTGIVTYSAAEGAQRYDPVIADIKATLDEKMPGERWTLNQTAPQQTNGRCLAVAGTWTTVPRSGLIEPKLVKADIDPVLQKHGFSATEVMSVEGTHVQLGAVEPGGASFKLDYVQTISIAIYYATTADQCHA